MEHIYDEFLICFDDAEEADKLNKDIMKIVKFKIITKVFEKITRTHLFLTYTLIGHLL
jgi:hypothetical protein